MEIFATGFLFASLASGSSLEAVDIFSINTTSSAPLATPQQDGYHDKIAIELFRRLDKKVRIRFLPGERSLINLNQGIDDATFVRIAGLRKSYPNVRIVPEKIMDFTFVAFSKNPTIVLNGWEDLKPYSVAYINGWKIFEQNVKGPKFLTRVSGPSLLFGLLKRERAEILLFNKWSGLYIARQEGMTEVRLLMPLLAIREMFVYVHKKHEALIPRLSAIIRSMKADGSYDKIFKETLGPLAES